MTGMLEMRTLLLQKIVMRDVPICLAGCDDSPA